MKLTQVGLLPNFNFGNSNRCTYCGDTPSGRDHVIPVSYQHMHSEQRIESNGPWTWACQQCNSQLASRWFDSFDERCRYVRDRLERLGRPIIWHEWEVKPLHYNLRQLILHTNAQRRWMRERADWYESREYWVNLENLQWAPLDKSLFLSNYFAPTLGLLKALLYENRDHKN